MGLSAMANAPDMDQAMRFANIMNHSHYIAPNAWVGEQNLNGLGLADGDPSNTINAVGNAATQVIGAIGQLRGTKKAKTPPASQTPAHTMTAMNSTSSSSTDMTKWLLYGGLAIGAVVILMMVMKKKKNGREIGD